MKVWVTGANGLIGHQLIVTAQTEVPHWQVIPITRTELDLLDFSALDRRLDSDQPDIVVHCAALSSSITCEHQPDLAEKINVTLTHHLAERMQNGILVLFSTDLVFNGEQGHYIETDTPDPMGNYASSKLRAETFVLNHPANLVIRTSINGGPSPSGLRGFNEAMVAAWKKGECLGLFVDEYRCPIHAEITAKATWALLMSQCSGIYHLAGAERLSRWQIGSLIAERWPQLKPRIQATSRTHYQGPPRPADTSLDCSKAHSVLPFQIPGLKTWLLEHPEAVF